MTSFAHQVADTFVNGDACGRHQCGHGSDNAVEARRGHHVSGPQDAYHLIHVVFLGREHRHPAAEFFGNTPAGSGIQRLGRGQDGGGRPREIERAAERLAEAGYDEGQVDEIFRLLPAATHNQRAEATLMIGTSREIDARDLIQIAEDAMSAPVFELLKRPDELFVVEQAHLHPRFVEDSVRLMVAGAMERYPDLSDGCFLLARQVNFETIHNHDVLAERHGVVGELRADLEGASDRPRHTTARAWLEGGKTQTA